MKEEEIKEVLARHRIRFAKHGTVYGTIIASVGAYQNGVGEIMHARKDHILHFNPDGMTILAVDDMKGTLCEETLLFIPREQIVSTDIRVRLFTFLLTVQTVKGEIRYKLRKNLLGSPWHKENLAYLLLSSPSQTGEECV